MTENKYFRSCQPSDLKVIDGCLFVMPREFEANKDSTIPTGLWSFWFSDMICPVNHPDIIVMGDFIPEAEGIMSFTETDDHTDPQGVIRYYHSLPEFVTSQPVKVEKIWVYLFAEEAMKSQYFSGECISCPLSGKNFYDGEEVDWDNFLTDRFFISEKEVRKIDGLCVERLLPLLDTSDGQKFYMPALAANMLRYKGKLGW
jgi:hypothetical protein